MPEPDVIRTIQEFRRALLDAEADQMRMMARRWAQLERSLEGQIAALALDIDRRRAAGEVIAGGKAYQLERYRLLLGQAREEMGKYVDYAQDVIGKQMLENAMLGADGAVAVLDQVYASDAVGVLFARLPVEAIEAMTGLTSGGPLRALLEEAWPDAAEGLTQALVEAIARGLNPRTTARMMREGLEQGFNRLLVIARTEQLRAWREATRAQYAKSGVVKGYRRMAAHQTRTCMACLFADGRVYGLNEPFQDHPNGRCTLVPILIGADFNWRTGREWFAGLDEGKQREIMGDKVWTAWKGGEIGYDDLIRTAHSSVWGDHLRPATLKELGLGSPTP